MFSRDKPMMVGWGMDRIAVNILVPRQLGRRSWDKLRDGNPHVINGMTVEVSNVWQEKEAFKRHAEITVFNKRRSTSSGFHVYSAAVGAKACAVRGAEVVMEALMMAARKLFSAKATIEVCYLELYVDLQGTGRPSKKLFKRSACLARKRVLKDRDDVLNPDGQSIQTMTWGNQGRASDNICAVYYEKPKLPSEDWRIAKWRRSGCYQENQTVRRLEFRVWDKGPLLKAKISPELASLAAGGLNSLWDYLTGSWLRILAKPRIDKRRVDSHRWWEAIQRLTPLVAQPLLAAKHLEPSAVQLELCLARAAGYLRNFAGLTDSAEDKGLAVDVTCDAAEELIYRIATRYSDPCHSID